MKKLITLLMAAVIALGACAYRYDYRTVKGDPMHSLLYTLPNGLKIFMTVNKDQPRIQTYIAVRVGGKNDPAETTGLAHYFEHMMFKGSEQFGTQDYAAEKPLLDQVEQLFETYRQTSDSTVRAQIYGRIDSISYQASLIAIPNEYDKLMSAIGANGTNAYTSTDVTCYVEDIPSNQIDNWAMIQADRFKHPVLRGFHTELETIYEEKNMSLTSDPRKSYEALLAMLFPTHPYGTQTVLGTQTHLKNPSITNIKKYHKQWYVPNNMAVCLSGDFDPDNMVDVITKYFGDMEPNRNLQYLPVPAYKPLAKPVSKEVTGLEAETLYMGWRIPANRHHDMLAIQVMAEVLQNGKCGVLDRNITIPQKMLSAGVGLYNMADGGAFMAIGAPKEGQTLDELRELFLAQMDSLRQGRFADDLVPAVVTNIKLELQNSLESNDSRASMFVNAFVDGIDWADQVAQLTDLDKITKADIVAMANKYLGADSYAAVYKRQGTPTDELKIAKPQLTPIATNRDKASDFLRNVQLSKVNPIEPVFVDFAKDLDRTTAHKGQVPVLYTRNKTNDLFQLTFVYEYGTNANRAFNLANRYLGLLGTPAMTVDQIKEAFYRLGCTYFVSASAERTHVVLRGLSENMDKALALYEKLVGQAVADKEVWAQVAENTVKTMMDNKSNQRANFSRLSQYAQYGGGDNVPYLQTQYSPAELRSLDPQTVVDAVRDMANYKHTVIYYGPMAKDQVVKVLDETRHLPATLADVPVNRKFVQPVTEETVIYVAPYDAKQLYLAMVSNRGKFYDPATEPARRFYNEYFGGGMNSIVFQEMRESRSLAYSAWATMAGVSSLDKPYLYMTQIATQNDKMGDAIDAFNLIINDMPLSQGALDLAKDGMESRLRTERTIKDDIAWAWLNAQRLGIDYDMDKKVFEALPQFTLDGVHAYQLANVKDNKYVYAILGNIADLDMDKLRSLGRVVILTTDQLFGF